MVSKTKKSVSKKTKNSNMRNIKNAGKATLNKKSKNTNSMNMMNSLKMGKKRSLMRGGANVTGTGTGTVVNKEGTSQAMGHMITPEQVLAQQSYEERINKPTASHTSVFNAAKLHELGEQIKAHMDNTHIVQHRVAQLEKKLANSKVNKPSAIFPKRVQSKLAHSEVNEPPEDFFPNSVQSKPLSNLVILPNEIVPQSINAGNDPETKSDRAGDYFEVDTDPYQLQLNTQSKTPNQVENKEPHIKPNEIVPQSINAGKVPETESGSAGDYFEDDTDTDPYQLQLNPQSKTPKQVENKEPHIKPLTEITTYYKNDPTYTLQKDTNPYISVAPDNTKRYFDVKPESPYYEIPELNTYNKLYALMKPSKNTQKEAPEYQKLSDIVISKINEPQYLPIDNIGQGDIKSTFYNPKDLEQPNLEDYEYGTFPNKFISNSTSFNTNKKNPINGIFRQYLPPKKPKRSITKRVANWTKRAATSISPKTLKANVISAFSPQKNRTNYTPLPKKNQQTSPPPKIKF